MSELEIAVGKALLKMRRWPKANVDWEVNQTVLGSYPELCDRTSSMEDLSRIINEDYHE